MTTQDEVHGLSNDQLRVKIAEALGWEKSDKPDDFGFYFLVDKNRGDAWLVLNKYGHVMQAKNAPNWPTDLNAAAELTAAMQPEFFRIMVITWDHTDRVGVVCEKRAGHDEVVPGIDVVAGTEPRARAEACLIWLYQKQAQS